MALIDAKLSKMIEQAGNIESSNNKGGLVNIIDQVLDHLVATGLAIHVQLPPKSVGVHWANRYGYGVSPMKSHKLGSLERRSVPCFI